jgi:hypothetical protein
MHARALAKILEAAVAATTLGGCCFGRRYAPADKSYVDVVDAKVASAARADASLPSNICRDVCGPLGDGETLLGCWAATVEAVPAPGSAGLPRGAVVVECRKHTPGGCDPVAAGRDTRARRTAFAPSARDVGSWLARAAQAERTAVRAFEEMTRELHELGAPRSLVRAARRARGDEVRHARTMTSLARAHGARVRPVTFHRTARRSLAAFAIENAVEGCVRELFAAAVAVHQSRAAAPELRDAFAAIARDETRHAALALRTFAWCRARLDAPTLARLERALDRALESLLEGWEPGDAALGLPAPRDARTLASRLAADVWAPLRASCSTHGVAQSSLG